MCVPPTGWGALLQEWCKRRHTAKQARPSHLERRKATSSWLNPLKDRLAIHSLSCYVYLGRHRKIVVRINFALGVDGVADSAPHL